jgi:CheY-like chemotaxis protein
VGPRDSRCGAEDLDPLLGRGGMLLQLIRVVKTRGHLSRKTRPNRGAELLGERILRHETTAGECGKAGGVGTMADPPHPINWNHSIPPSLTHVTGGGAVHSSILFVEDDPTLAEAVSMLLGMEGVDVKVVHDGRLVVGMVARSKPDVVVLDVSLGEVNGVVVARALRDAWPLLPIVFSTGNAEAEDVRNALADRRMTVVQKPYSIETLVGAIENAMRT